MNWTSAIDNRYEGMFQEWWSMWNHLGTARKSSQGGRIQSRSIRLEFPCFDGEDPSGWIYRCNSFFAYHWTPTNQKKTSHPSIWKEELDNGFGGRKERVPLMDGRILCRFWIHNLGQAVWRSSRFSCKTSAIHDNSGVPGLKEEVWLGVQMFRPSSLSATTSFARLQEEKNWTAKRFHHPDTIEIGDRSYKQLWNQQRLCFFPTEE